MTTGQLDFKENFRRFSEACPNRAPNDVVVQCKVCYHKAPAWLWIVDQDARSPGYTFLKCAHCFDYYVKYSLQTANVVHPLGIKPAYWDKNAYKWLLSSRSPAGARFWAWAFLLTGAGLYVLALWALLHSGFVIALVVAFVGYLLRRTPRGIAPALYRRAARDDSYSVSSEEWQACHRTLADFTF